VDADAIRIGDAFGDRPAGGVGQIVLHRPAPLAIAGQQEGAPVAAGAPEIDLQHGVTIGDQPLDGGVEAPLVAFTDGPTVRVDH